MAKLNFEIKSKKEIDVLVDIISCQLGFLADQATVEENMVDGVLDKERLHECIDAEVTASVLKERLLCLNTLRSQLPDR